MERAKEVLTPASKLNSDPIHNEPTRSFRYLYFIPFIVPLFLIPNISIKSCLISFAKILIIILILIVISIAIRVKKPKIFPRHNKFKFLSSNNYHNPSSTAVNARSQSEIDHLLTKLIDLIIGQFIDSWYNRISPSRLFQSTLREELQHVMNQMKARLESVDFSDVLVNPILDVLREHFSYYCQAETMANMKGLTSRIPVDSKEHQLAIAQNYNRGKLHRGVDISTDDHRSPEIDFRKEHLRKKVAEILPFLLSPNEASSELVTTLVREILACTVLSSVFDVVSDSDFFNLLIVNFIGGNLRRRNQVKQLRAALEEYTRSVDFNAGNNEDYNEQENKSTSGLVKSPTHNADVSGIELEDILSSPTALEAFRAYSAEQGRSKILEIWEQIESIKSPLGEQENPDLSLSLEFATSDDMTRAYEMLIGSSLLVDTDNMELLSQYIQQKLFSKARRLLFNIQSNLFDLMSAELADFLQSSYFQPGMIKLDFHDDILDSNSLAVSENADDKTVNEVSPVVFHAVEDAFNEIMKSSKTTDDRLFYHHKQGSASFTSLLESVELGPDVPPVPLNFTPRKDLFGDEKDMNFDDIASTPSRASRLFEDRSDSSESDSDADVLSDREPEMLDLKVLFAAPGNLKLSEEVLLITKDIERLSEQIIVLSPLLRKAELTHNITELKILRKSKIGLEREIEAKELQKQQYLVQENENSLFGKLRVQIQSYISGNDKGKEYILYIVEVQRFTSEDLSMPSAGWVVARRFSQFHHLHVYLRKKYPPVEQLKFPKKAVLMLKFQQRQLIEIRKAALEEYLCQLLKLPEVCSDRVLRSFLSSENFHFGRNKGILKSLRNKGGPLRELPNRQNPVAGPAVSKLMQAELSQYDSPRAFVKPICDLLITVFELNSSKGWLRGRALVVILQQVFGTTIENMVRDQEKSLRSDERVQELVISMTNMLFPNGKFREPPAVRNAAERAQTRQEARALLKAWMSITCSKIFGATSTNHAQARIFAMLQNDYLNLHLLLTILDEVIDVVGRPQ